MKDAEPAWARWCLAGILSALAAIVIWPLAYRGLTTRVVVISAGASAPVTIGRFEGAGAILVSVGLILLWMGLVAAMVWLVIWLNDCD